MSTRPAEFHLQPAQARPTQQVINDRTTALNGETQESGSADLASARTPTGSKFTEKVQSDLALFCDPYCGPGYRNLTGKYLDGEVLCGQAWRQADFHVKVLFGLFPAVAFRPIVLCSCRTRFCVNGLHTPHTPHLSVEL